MITICSRCFGLKPPICIPSLLDQAVLEFEDLANEYWKEISPSLFSREQSKGLRMSDMGSCVRQKWFSMRDLLTIPEDSRSKLTRLENGTFFGARMACYIKAGMAKQWPGMPVLLEETINYRGFPGHVDVILDNWPIEIKSNYRKAPLKDPTAGEYHNSFQAWQGAGYGLARSSAIFSVLTIGPAVEDSERTSSPHLRMDTYPTANFKAAVDSEIDRLSKAKTSETPPEGDVPRIWGWRCKFCRESTCVRNVNPRKEIYEDAAS